MTPRSFTIGSDSSMIRLLLSFAAAGYYVVQKTRETAFRHGILRGMRGPVPVVSVGNLLLGGSGKTPFVIHVAQMLVELGLKPAVVSRGYRGSYRGDFLVVGGPASGVIADPSVCGDEPFLIFRRLPHVPVLVGKKRIHPVRAAHELFGCDVVVLDDGFQHLLLERELDIVLLNGTEDWMFPLGRLREPLSALRRAHAVVLVGSDSRVPPRAERFLGEVPRIRAVTVPQSLERGGGRSSLPPEHLAGRAVTLASAIANPHRFRATAEALGWGVRGHVTFPDHHALTEGELRDLLRRAHGSTLVVTEKDWVKLPRWFTDNEDVMALRIGMRLCEEQTLRTLLLSLKSRIG